MGATDEAAATWEITGARHAGITVSDLDRSLEFYCGLLGLELLWRRHYEEPEIAEIVGVPEATGFDIAFLGIPGSDPQVELLQYHGSAPVSGFWVELYIEPAYVPGGPNLNWQNLCGIAPCYGLAWQVRQPLYQSSVRRWPAYREQLAEIMHLAKTNSGT